MGNKNKDRLEEEGVSEGSGSHLQDADFSELGEDIAIEDLPIPEESDQLFEESQAGDGAQLAELRAEVNEFKDKYLRSLADFENFKKRSLKERSDLLKYQGERVLLDMLEVVDLFHFALQADSSDAAKFREGVELIFKRFMEILGKWEVRDESGVGQTFDPSKHAAISRIQSEDSPEGVILNELKRAFFYKDKLLRPGEVVVSAGKPAVEPTGEESAG